MTLRVLLVENNHPFYSDLIIMAYAKLLHLLSVLIWVGGMFFAYMILRPAAVEVLEPPPRLRLWANVFGRFFPWVWASVAEKA